MERNVKGGTDTAAANHSSCATRQQALQHLLDLLVVLLLDTWRRLAHLCREVKQIRPVPKAPQLPGSDAVVGAQDTLDRRRLEQALEHAAGAPVLEALVRGEAVLGAVPAVAELAHVQGVRLLVLVLEVPLQRVVAGEGAMAVRTLLRLVDSSTGGRGHLKRLTTVELVPFAAGATVAARAQGVVAVGAAVGRLRRGRVGGGR